MSLIWRTDGGNKTIDNLESAGAPGV